MQLLGQKTFSQVGRSPQFISLVAIFSISVVGASVTGLEFEAIIRLSFVCTVMSVSGVFIMAPSRDVTSEIIPGLIAKGIGVGIPLAALSHQLFLHSVLRPIGWLVPALIVLPRMVSHIISLRKSSTSDLPNTMQDLFTVVTFAFVSMTTAGWWFLIPPSVILVGVLMSNRVRCRRRTLSPIGGGRDTMSLLLIGFGLFVSIVMARYFADRNFFYFFRSFDQLFRSAIATGLNEWGANDNIAAVGTPLRYHWLAEASVGLIAKVSGYSTLQVLSRFAPFLFTYAACAALWSLAKKFGLSFAGIVIGFGGILWLTQTFDLYTIRQPLGFALFFLFLGELSEFEASPTQLKHILHVAIFCPLILLVDTPLGVVACITTVLIGLLNGILARIPIRYTLLLIVVGPLSILSLRFTLLNTKSEMIYNPIFGVENLLQFGRNAFGIYSGKNWWLTALVSMALLSFGSFRWVGIYGPQNVKRLLKAPRITCLMPALVGLLLTNLFSIGASIGDAVQGAFLVGFIALPLLSADSITHDFAHGRHRSGFWLIAILPGVCLGVFLHYAFGLDDDKARRIALIFTMMFPIVVLLTAWFTEWLSTRYNKFKWSQAKVTRQGIQVAILVSLLVSASFAIFAGATNLTKSIRDDHGYLGNSAQLECLKWIRDNTPRESVVVSNLWRIPLPTQDQKYFLVSNQTERRILIDGPLYVDYSLSNAIAERMTLSEEFINSPSETSFKYMKLKDVSVAYVDFKYSKNRNLEPYARTVFINDGCLVAILR